MCFVAYIWKIIVSVREILLFDKEVTLIFIKKFLTNYIGFENNGYIFKYTLHLHIESGILLKILYPRAYSYNDYKIPHLSTSLVKTI